MIGPPFAMFAAFAIAIIWVGYLKRKRLPKFRLRGDPPPDDTSPTPPAPKRPRRATYGAARYRTKRD